MKSRFGLHPSVLGAGPIALYTNHLAELVRYGDPKKPVTTAGSWTLADLAKHLTEVQDFWAWIIEHRPSGPDWRAEAPGADEPGDTAASRRADELSGACDRLVNQLNQASPSDQAWSWDPDYQTVDFSIRRQTHEALIHCFDGVFAVDGPWPEVASELAADGLDELFTIMAGGAPEWATYNPSDRRLLVTAPDSGDQWNLEFGSITGESPLGTVFSDEPMVEVVDPSRPSAAELRGSALDLDLWAWGRRSEAELEVEGDRSLVTALRDLIVGSTQ